MRLARVATNGRNAQTVPVGSFDLKCLTLASSRSHGCYLIHAEALHSFSRKHPAREQKNAETAANQAQSGAIGPR